MSEILYHGGRLKDASHVFGDRDNWLDLSTGVSPWAYPVKPFNQNDWQVLPEERAQLIAAARSFYREPTAEIIPVPGSQFAIQWLPFLLTKKARVAVPSCGYREHQFWWKKAGHRTFEYERTDQLPEFIEKKSIDHVVFIQPNNPTAEVIENELVESVLSLIPADGVCILDQAFADYIHSQQAADILSPKLIKLKSFGKFFGLPGMRLGFVVTSAAIADQLKCVSHQWSIPQWVVNEAASALKDEGWHNIQRMRVNEQSEEIVRLLNHFDGLSVKSAGLFITVLGSKEKIDTLYHHAGEHGIFLRYGEYLLGDNAWLRLGLPGDRWDEFEQWLGVIQ